MKKRIALAAAVVVALLAVVIAGGSFYMLDVSLKPYDDRRDTSKCFARLSERYPETAGWLDSLRRVGAFRDTFAMMPSGERHHAYYIDNHSNRTAFVLHGWHDCPIDYMFLSRIYDHELGYNVVMPDIHAHGLSDGGMIRMGWLDRFDILHWMEVFRTDTMVVHGESMGGATTMMVSGEKMPEGIKDIRFVDDCGYTDVWDEFAGELKARYGLPEFPLMYTTSLLCKMRYGWDFKEASALEQVRKCPYPMLFVHGGSDTFVPTRMVHPLYEAKPDKKLLWVAEGSEHILSYKDHREEYIRRVKEFLEMEF